MSEPKRKQVVFLEGQPGDRGRLAVERFNAVAAKLGLPFEAISRPSVPADGLVAAVVVWDRAEIASGQVEHWQIPDGADAAPAIDRQVSALIARLLGGRTVAEPPPATARKEPPKKVHTVRVGRETAGRHGKGVTTVFDLPMNEDAMKELATTLKQKCGTGGTVKDGRIEIQGDHRDRITAELERLGYKVKRSGG